MQTNTDTFTVISLIFLIQIGVSSIPYAQSSLSTKSKKAIAYYQEADNYRVRRQYYEAITLLHEAIKKDDQFVEAYIRLANIYSSIDELVFAEKNYQQAINLASNDSKYADAYLSITELMITQEKYDQAKTSAKKYLRYQLKNRKKNRKAKLFLDKAIYSTEHLSDSLTFNPESLNPKVNQFAMQYFPVVTADQNTLLYTKRDGNSPYDDEDIMISYKDENGIWEEPQSISPNINSDLNEGTCAISADGRTLVFTSCQGRNSYGSCDLFISYKSGQAWSIPENMGSTINSPAWESQPSLSADGRTLYFVSNRKGGYGGRDIWVSLQKEGKWHTPQNLGRNINTSNEEVSPFIHPNNKTLYFASDGLPGFGGFDIYYNELDSTKNWKLSKNIGYPINRGTDQMSLIITADGSKGFYSDSEGSKQRMSTIKQFNVPKQIKIKYRSHYVSGVISDQKTHKSLKAQIQLYDLSTNELIGEVISDSISGEYLMVLTEGGKYGLYIEKKGYIFQSKSFNFLQVKAKESLKINIQLESITTGAITVLNNIFFEHNSYVLSDDSLTELDKVAHFIGTNKVRLEIGGYTDSSGTAAYNLSLSQKRAEAVYQYLIKMKNIPQNALTFHGYGQDENTESTEDRLLRRIEFKLI